MSKLNPNRPRMYVRCYACRDEHYVDKVKFVDVYEHITGEDVMKFVCPKTKTVEESFVFKE
jgi:hypothetical protein